jgi:hypothetical protein
MSKYTLALFAIFLMPSCVVYTEKQSEALSQAVYLADDSFEAGRFDVTDFAIDQAIRIVKIPKTRQTVNSVTVTQEPSKQLEKAATNNENTKTAHTSYEDKKVLLVPERFKDQEVIVVNSHEYQKLLEDKKTFTQLQGDYKTLQTLKKNIDDELTKQTEYNNQLIIKINSLKEEVANKNTLILKLYITIGGLIFTMVAGIYLRIKGIL